MTPADAVFTVKRVRELWPNCDWSEQVEDLFGERIMRFDRDQTVTALEDYRARQPGRSPDVSKLLSHITERLRQPTDYGYRLKGHWNTIANRLGLNGASMEQVVVAYWKSFREIEYWTDESLWRGIVADLRADAGMELDQAAYIADNAVGEQLEALESIRRVHAEMDAMTKDGRKEAFRKIRERIGRGINANR